MCIKPVKNWNFPILYEAKKWNLERFPGNLDIFNEVQGKKCIEIDYIATDNVSFI